MVQEENYNCVHAHVYPDECPTCIFSLSRANLDFFGDTPGAPSSESVLPVFACEEGAVVVVSDLGGADEPWMVNVGSIDAEERGSVGIDDPGVVTGCVALGLDAAGASPVR
jgi:hypothetical protein